MLAALDAKNNFELMLTCFEKNVGQIPLSERYSIKIALKKTLEGRVKIRKTLKEVPGILSVSKLLFTLAPKVNSNNLGI